MNHYGQPRASILGAGPAGFALACDLIDHGFDIILYSHPRHTRHVDHVLRRGHVECTGRMTGRYHVQVTTNIASALAFSTNIILTVPSTGQETLLKEIAPLKIDLRRHTIIATPGNGFALIASSYISAAHILETNISPYSCRMHDNILTVLGKKSRFSIAALDEPLTASLHRHVQRIFPMMQLKWCANPIEVCLSNINGVFHPLMMLLNTGWVERTAGDFCIYSDGLTPAVAKAITAVDEVRLQIGDMLGMKLKGVVQTSNELYNHTFVDLVDLAQNSKPHQTLRAPETMQHRNILEDVPDLLVFWMELAEQLGIDASAIRTTVVLAEMVTGKEFIQSGRNLKRLNLDTLTKEQLIERFVVVDGLDMDDSMDDESDMSASSSPSLSDSGSVSDPPSPMTPPLERRDWVAGMDLNKSGLVSNNMTPQIL